MKKLLKVLLVVTLFLGLAGCEGDNPPVIKGTEINRTGRPLN